MHSFRNLEATTKIWRGFFQVPDTNVYIDDSQVVKPIFSIQIFGSSLAWWSLSWITSHLLHKNKHGLLDQERGIALTWWLLKVASLVIFANQKVGSELNHRYFRKWHSERMSKYNYSHLISEWSDWRPMRVLNRQVFNPNEYCVKRCNHWIKGIWWDVFVALSILLNRYKGKWNKWKDMEAAEAATIEPPERCMTWRVQIAAVRPRFPSSQMDPDRYTARIAIRSISPQGLQGDIKTIWLLY